MLTQSCWQFRDAYSASCRRIYRPPIQERSVPSPDTIYIDEAYEPPKVRSPSSHGSLSPYIRTHSFPMTACEHVFISASPLLIQAEGCSFSRHGLHRHHLQASKGKIPVWMILGSSYSYSLSSDGNLGTCSFLLALIVGFQLIRAEGCTCH